jgi:cold-inducible RNA-binding protein
LSIRNRGLAVRFQKTSSCIPEEGKVKTKMSMKLYVGNISFNTTNQDLNDLFGAIGTVESANIVEDRETGRSRGFGFVEMASKEEAENAIAQLNGKEVDGRELKVNEAKPQESRGGGGRGGYGGGGGRGGNRGGGGGGGYGGGSRW